VGRLSRLLVKVFPEGSFGRLWAKSYHDQITRRFPDFYRRVAEEVMMGKTEGRILDVGTGPAYLPIEIARVAPKTKIIAIDISEEVLSIAKRNVEAASLSEKVTLEPGDVNRLGYPDATFDIVVMTGVLFSCKERVRALNEAYRVLKPGGETCIYDFAGDLSKEEVKMMMDEMRRRGVSRSWRIGTRLALSHTYTAEQLSKTIRASMFDDYRVERTRICEWPLLRAKLVKSSKTRKDHPLQPPHEGGKAQSLPRKHRELQSERRIKSVDA